MGIFRNLNPGKILQKAADISDKVLSFGAEALVSPVAREFERPIVSTVRGVQGLIPGGHSGEGAMRTPFGTVKPYKDVDIKDAASGTFELLTSVPGVGTAAKVGAKTVAGGAGKVASKVLPSTAKIASQLTNVGEEAFKIAGKVGSERLQGAKDVVAETSNLIDVGKGIYNKANEVRGIAMDTWGAAEKEIIEKVGTKFQAGLKQAKTSMQEALKDEGIKIGNKGVSLAGSKFAGSKSAADVFQRVWDVAREGGIQVEALMNKRSALGTILEEVPLAEKNLRRVVKGMITKYDDVLDDVTEGAYKKMSQSYAETIGPVNKFIDNVTDVDGNFSADKAVSFIKTAMSDQKFDKGEILGGIDELTEKLSKEIDGFKASKFLENVKTLGAAKALSSLAPKTGSRIWDVVASYAITKLPVLGLTVSPEFWGRLMAKQGDNVLRAAGELPEKTISRGKQVKNFLVKFGLLLLNPGRQPENVGTGGDVREAQAMSDFNAEIDSLLEDGNGLPKINQQKLQETDLEDLRRSLDALVGTQVQ